MKEETLFDVKNIIAQFTLMLTIDIN
jgi:hypothetical protein